MIPEEEMAPDSTRSADSFNNLASKKKVKAPKMKQVP